MAVEWDEISDAASGIFSIWTSGGDLDFAKESWTHLAAGGLTSDDCVYDLTRTLLRLIALRLIYGEFCAAKWDEQSETPISYLVEDLEIDPLALGLIAGDYLAPGSELGDPFSLRAAALEAAVKRLRPYVFACLLNAYGGSIDLYSRLSRTAANLDANDDSGDGATVTGDCAALDFIRKHSKR
jgi:hypothetical protein